jgi:SAM-dependent methyltransferase
VSSAPPTRRELFRLFLAEKRDPEPFYRRLAEGWAADFSFPLDQRRVLDLGCGPGHYTRAMRAAGAVVVPVDLNDHEVRGDGGGEPPEGFVSADGTKLPFPSGSFDGVVCSNMLEHTPTPERIISEIERVLVPGGWGWVSWTNWYSPWGGHEIVPLHYLGPNLGLKAWRRLKGEPRKNVPFEALWPTYIGRTLDMVRRTEGIELVDAVPRYYPSQRWILKVPGLREVATWNCLLYLRRTESPLTASRR